ncbi:hypothetical protein ACFP56_15020 [Paenibacillus septentrionalis]|uniref:DUF2530 domain-containing protein n=1 Tax=Paenibacillus septentrionalis TaxID=429342 RepID=A0ABW1V568_9BACL
MNSNSKSITIHEMKSAKPDATKLVNIMTMIAWLVLGIGVVLCLANITEFNDRNWGLMIGIGFLVGSVHIYVIGTAIGLVHKRALHQTEEQREQSQ